MRVPDTAFIDTSIFDGQQYNFESREFRAFKTQFGQNAIKLLLPNPTRREIERHLADRSGSAAQAFEAAQQKAPFVRRLPDWPLASKSKEQVESEIRASAQHDLTEFLDRYKTTDLNYSGISVEEVMNWYDDITAPFGHGNKRKEFPDAFAVAALDAHHKVNGLDIAVIAADNDLKAACISRAYLIYYESLSAYVEAARFEEQKIVQIDRLLGADSSLADAIKERFPELGFVIEENWDGEVLEVEVSDIKFTELRLSDIDQEGFSISYRATISYTADLHYDDYDTATYDSEDKVLIPFNQLHKSISDQERISGSAEFSVAQDWQTISELLEVIIDQETFNIIAREHDDWR